MEKNNDQSKFIDSLENKLSERKLREAIGGLAEKDFQLVPPESLLLPIVMSRDIKIESVGLNNWCQRIHGKKWRELKHLRHNQGYRANRFFIWFKGLGKEVVIRFFEHRDQAEKKLPIEKKNALEKFRRQGSIGGAEMGIGVEFRK